LTFPRKEERMSPFYLNRMRTLAVFLFGTVLLGASLVRAAGGQPPKGDGDKTKRTRAYEELHAAELFLIADERAVRNRFTEAIDQLIVLQDQGDEVLGATLKPVGDALRAQLEIPAGQGLLVSSLRNDGPSALAGLKLNDVILTLADKPLAAADDVSKVLRATGENPVPLRVLRTGQPVTLHVRPVYHVTLGPVEEKKTEYYIGVSIDPVGDPLRAQLAVPAGQGVLITDVLAGSPAEKAGVKKHDVVLVYADKPVESPEHLAKLVQANQDKSTTLKLIRAGKPVEIPVAAAVRKVEPTPSQDREAVRVWLLDQQQPANFAFTTGTKLRHTNVNVSGQVTTDDLPQRLSQVEKELKALHEALDRLNETLKTSKTPKH
jgi:C-terminal processing protease CtpA/Prc